MARRKQQYIDDKDSSGESDSAPDLDDDPFDPDDPDQAAERELFRNPYNRGKKRTREQLQEEATYGVWAQDDGEGAGVGGSSTRRGGGTANRKPDYLKGQSFVAAGSDPKKATHSFTAQPTDNLATALAIEQAAEDEENVAMEMESSDEDDEEQEREVGGDAGERSSDDDEALDDPDAAEEDAADLPPVPGLARPKSPTPPPPPAAPSSAPSSAFPFAPRGLGAGRGRGGLGMRSGIGGAGLDAGRSGLGAGAGRGGVGAAPMFAAAGATLSTVPAGETTPSGSASGTASPMAGASTPRAGLGAARGGIGSGSGGGAGIGARPAGSLVDALRAELAGPAPARGETATEALTSADEASRSASPAPAPTQAQERRSFLPTATAAESKPSFTAPKSKLSKAESAHFASLASSGSIGMRMLEKMGWSSGTGLGKERQGIITPVGEGQKLRKKNEGIRQGERSKGALEEEARRRGPAAGTDDAGDSATRAAAADEKRAKHASAWQSAKPKKEKKKRTEYKTYDEIVAESGGEAYQPQQELLVDLTGQALPSQSLSTLPTSLHGAGSADPTRLPELRHNLTLLTTTFSSSLRALAREGAGVAQRRAYLAKEEARVRAAVEEQERKVHRLEGVMKLVERVREQERQAGEVLRAMEGGAAEGGVDPLEVLNGFEELFDALLGEYAAEYEQMRLDEVVVAALTPILRRLWTTWDPLSRPTYTVPALKRFRKHFLIDRDLTGVSGDAALLAPSADPYEEEERRARLRKVQMERSMTPYEAMLWQVWVPKIRSAINNVWSPTDPEPAVALYTAWAPLLPRFLQDNVLDQLILPKVTAAIGEWTASAQKRGGPSLHALVFPWLDLAGERMEGVMDEAKRKVRSWIKSSWKPREGVPQGLEVWKEAFSRTDWDTLLLKHVLPSLGSLLRSSFTVNPRQQDLAPLDAVLAWKGLLRGSMLSQVLEAEFFPKWGEALYLWLTAEPNLEQVAEWYSWWKSYFPEDVVALSGVARGFRKGLDLMNQAMALGEDAKYRLKKPDFSAKHAPSSSASTPLPSATPTPRRPTAPSAPAEPADFSFRTVVEEVAAASNLVFLPTGKVTAKGQQLFRVSQSIEGRGGVTVYLEDDVVWIAEKGGEYSPVSVEGMVSRALGGKATIGTLHTWQKIFAMEGTITAAFGIIFFFILPSNPETTRSLNEDERKTVLQRLQIEHLGQTREKTMTRGVFKTIFNPFTWAATLGYIFINVIVQGTSLFLPTIIAGLGKYTTTETQFRTVPPFVVALGRSNPTQEPSIVALGRSSLPLYRGPFSRTPDRSSSVKLEVESTPPTSVEPETPVIKLEEGEEKDVKPKAEEERRRSRRSKAPGAANIKPVKKEEKTAEELQELWDDAPPRPEFMQREGFNLLDPETFVDISELTPTLPTFPPSTSSRRKSDTRTFKSSRWCVRSDLQLGITEPGNPCVLLTGIDECEEFNNNYGDVSLFPRIRKPRFGGDEIWRPFGLYTMVYNGPARDGEFLTLPSDKQQVLINAVHGYLTGKSTVHTDFLFAKCDLKPSEEFGPSLPLLQYKARLSKEEQKAYIRDCLEKNKHIRIAYSLVVYKGTNMDEVNECKIYREENRLAFDRPRTLDEFKARIDAGKNVTEEMEEDAPAEPAGNKLKKRKGKGKQQNGRAKRAKQA
ncbi:hypothetical protein JCM10207_008285 [Rhodosporidiobolus poonsookiae]